MDDGAEGGGEVLAPPRVSTGRRLGVGGGERIQAGRVADLFECGEERDRQPFRRQQTVAQVVQRETAPARGERLMDGAADGAPFLADARVGLLLFAAADAIDQLLQFRQPGRP
jgi:hypothetical protein